jgi:hypothetical protein
MVIFTPSRSISRYRGAFSTDAPARSAPSAARSLTINQPVSLEGARSGGTARPTKYIGLAETGAVLDPRIICKGLGDYPTGDAAPPGSGRGVRFKSCHSDQWLAEFHQSSGTTSGTEYADCHVVFRRYLRRKCPGSGRFDAPSGEERERPDLRSDFSTCAMVDGIRVGRR